MEATQGAFRIFGKVRDGFYWDQNANYCLAIKDDGVILNQTEWRTPLDTTISLFDFGPVYLPPWLGSNQGLAGLNIELKIWRKTYGTSTIKLDYLALLPETDVSGVEKHYIANPLAPSEPPELYYYPRAGTPNARVRLGIVSIDAGPTSWIDWDREKYPVSGTRRLGAERSSDHSRADAGPA